MPKKPTSRIKQVPLSVWQDELAEAGDRSAERVAKMTFDEVFQQFIRNSSERP